MLLSLGREHGAHCPRQPLKKITGSDDVAVPSIRYRHSILELLRHVCLGKGLYYIALWRPLLRIGADERLLERGCDRVG